MQPMIEIFGKSIASYGLCACIGFLASVLVAIFIGKKRGISYDEVILIAAIAALGIFLGGWLLFVFTQLKEVIEVLGSWGEIGTKSMWEQLRPLVGGLVFYGGLIGAMVAVKIFATKARFIQKENAMDLFVTIIPLFHAFGRVGCFLGGCCYGMECSWGMTVYNNPYLPELCGVPRFPSALTEAACNIGIFLFLLFLYRKKKYHGKLWRWYFFLYPVVRFTLEFFRGDRVRGIWGGLSTSQWISILLLFTVFLSLMREKRRKKCEKI